ncbi:MAG: SEC-C domain-containing protein [Syntrophomonas sp.]
MADLKVGRNDLCPCGSGKKYKKCCGVLEDVIDLNADLFVRYSQILTEVKIKLDQYYGQQIKKIRKDLQTRFLRFTVNKYLPREHESIFSDWLWFDKTSAEGDTLGFNYFKENGKYMHPMMLECLHALNFSNLSIYEVKGFEEQHLDVEDIFTSQSFKVLLKEPWEADVAENPVILMGRLLRTSDEAIFSGMVLICDNKAGQKEFIKEHIEYLSLISREKINEVLKFNGDILYGIFDHAYNKVLLSLNNIEVSPINETERTSLLNELMASQDYALLHESEGFKWFQPTADVYGYVRIAISDEQLVSCAEILDDVLQIRKLAATALPQIEFTVLNNLLLPGPPPLEFTKLWFTVLKDKECERWLDTPHSELEEKTPHEILKGKDGKEKLFAILNDFSSSLEGENEKELIEYMKTRIEKY